MTSTGQISHQRKYNFSPTKTTLHITVLSGMNKLHRAGTRRSPYRGVPTPYPRGSTPYPRPFFFHPYPRPIFPYFFFFSGTPAQNSDFPAPRPSHPNPLAPVPLSSPTYKIVIYLNRRTKTTKAPRMATLDKVTTAQRAHDAMITSIFWQNNVSTSFWRNNDAKYCIVCPLGPGCAQSPNWI